MGLERQAARELVPRDLVPRHQRVAVDARSSGGLLRCIGGFQPIQRREKQAGEESESENKNRRFHERASEQANTLAVAAMIRCVEDNAKPVQTCPVGNAALHQDLSPQRVDQLIHLVDEVLHLLLIVAAIVSTNSITR